MTTSASDAPETAVDSVRFEDDYLVVTLSDGRAISIPLHWYPRLQHSTTEERSSWEIGPDGSGIHWPDIDEDISVHALLAGKKSRESKTSLEQWFASRGKKDD